MLKLLIGTSGLLLEVWRLKDLGLLENLGLDRIRSELDVQAPILDILTLRYHFVQGLDRFDPIVRFLEEALAHLCDCLLVFPHLLRDTDKHGKFGRQIDVLTLLLDFKQGLIHFRDLLIVLLLEVGRHRDGSASLSLLEIARLGAHIKAHVAHLVGLVVPIHGHDNRTLELIKDSLLVFLCCRRLLGLSISLLPKLLDLLIDQLQAVVNRQIFADIVDDEVKTALENPR